MELPTKKNPIPQLLFSILCDDIRRELGNKVSLMGIYNDSILVTEIPRIIPKLCIHQRWQGLPVEGEVRIGITGPGFNLPQIGIEYEQQKDANLPHPVETFDFSVAFSNVIFKQEGTYKITAYLGDAQEPLHVQAFYVKKYTS